MLGGFACSERQMHSACADSLPDQYSTPTQKSLCATDMREDRLLNRVGVATQTLKARHLEDTSWLSFATLPWNTGYNNFGPDPLHHLPKTPKNLHLVLTCTEFTEAHIALACASPPCSRSLGIFMCLTHKNSRRQPLHGSDRYQLGECDDHSQTAV